MSMTKKRLMVSATTAPRMGVQMLSATRQRQLIERKQLLGQIEKIKTRKAKLIDNEAKLETARKDEEAKQTAHATKKVEMKKLEDKLNADELKLQVAREEEKQKQTALVAKKKQMKEMEARLIEMIKNRRVELMEGEAKLQAAQAEVNHKQETLRAKKETMKELEAKLLTDEVKMNARFNNQKQKHDKLATTIATKMKDTDAKLKACNNRLTVVDKEVGAAKKKRKIQQGPKRKFRSTNAQEKNITQPLAKKILPLTGGSLALIEIIDLLDSMWVGALDVLNPSVCLGDVMGEFNVLKELFDMYLEMKYDE